MKERRSFSDEDREWLIANYPHITNRQAREHLQCGFYKLRTFVFECGLEYKTTYQKEVAPVEERKAWQDKDACGGYCMDCEYYKTGGECRKTGRSIGALWQKQCFAHRTTEPVVVRVETSTTKRCKICGEVKHFTEFWKHPKTKSFTNICQACASEAKREGAKAMHESKRSRGGKPILPIPNNDNDKESYMMESITTTKKCSMCGRELPVEEFHKNKRCKDGLMSFCKECHLKSARTGGRRKKTESVSPVSPVSQPIQPIQPIQEVQPFAKCVTEKDCATEALRLAIGEDAFADWKAANELYECLLRYYSR